MIKTENAENELDTITFSHSFQVPIGEVKHMMPKQFATIHQFCLVNWHIQITETGGIPAFIRNIVEPGHRDSVYQITLYPAGQREKHPPVESIEFRIRIVNSPDKGKNNKSEIIKNFHFPEYSEPIRFIHPPGFPIRSIFNAGYSTPERGPIREFLNQVIGNKKYENHQFEIQTFIIFDINKFLSMSYLNQSIGKPMPIDLNFRYNLLTNQSTHNFHLKTSTNQSFACNKEALFVASPFFRKNFNSEMTWFQLDVEFLEAIEVAVTWLLSETYHPPEKMTPELAEEIVRLTERIVPRGPNQRKLLGSVERHCFEELIQNYDDMLYVKHLLLVAHNKSLGSLLEACHATIIYFHYLDFNRDMKQNPNPGFYQQAQMTRSNAITRLTDNYMKSLCVKSFTRKATPIPQLT